MNSLKFVVIPMALLLLFTADAPVIQGKKNTVEMISWEQADKLIPRYSKFTVQDLETGKKFHVQRRAGSRHADVQPLTTKDTKIMKHIYNGKWSWKRRGIIVIAKGKMIAASMHGMPHGAGALNNNFPGHFCIHFYGSKTHRTSSMDLSHKLMIFKAAGELDNYFESAGPYELVAAYFAGLKQQDLKIIHYAALQKPDREKIINQIENVTVLQMPALPAENIGDALTLSVPVELALQLKGIGPEKYIGTITIVRFSPWGPWKVDSKQFLEEVEVLAR
ncbi:hypothetical protein [Mesobacillus foraminis]|uniref:hypothetical protein n=1 Tax=Mesobacillus foraminis TaxID=279826 RepID=UPI00353154E0